MLPLAVFGRFYLVQPCDRSLVIQTTKWKAPLHEDLKKGAPTPENSQKKKSEKNAAHRFSNGEMSVLPTTWRFQPPLKNMLVKLGIIFPQFSGWKFPKICEWNHHQNAKPLIHQKSGEDSVVDVFFGVSEHPQLQGLPKKNCINLHCWRGEKHPKILGGLVSFKKELPCGWIMNLMYCKYMMYVTYVYMYLVKYMYIIVYQSLLVIKKNLHLIFHWCSRKPCLKLRIFPGRGR